MSAQHAYCSECGCRAEDYRKAMLAAVSDYDRLADNLTATQKRCRELKEENAKLKAENPRNNFDLSKAVLAYLRSEGFYCDLSKTTMREAAAEIAERLEAAFSSQAMRGVLEPGIILPGWTCEARPDGKNLCGAFNGEAKEKREVCRACGQGKRDNAPLLS